MSDAVIIAWIGGAAGIVTALIAGVPKLYDMYKSHKGDTIENRISERIEEIIGKKIEPIEKRQKEIQCDVCRMRLLSLMRHEPEDAENIIKVSKKYFCEYHGNSEASLQFERWLKKENIKTPEWFDGKGCKNGYCKV